MSYGSVGRSDAKQRVSEIQEYVTNIDVTRPGRLRVVGRVRGRHFAGHLRRLLAHLLPHPGPVLGAAAAAEVPSLCLLNGMVFNPEVGFPGTTRRA